MSDGKRCSMKFQGISISSGRIAGKLCLYSAERHKAIPRFILESKESVELELKRFIDIREQCSSELSSVVSDVEKAVGKAEAEIFTTQIHIINDPKVVFAIVDMVRKERKNLAWAIYDVLSGYEEKFLSLDNQYLRERSSDISEIKRRLLSKVDDVKGGFLCQGQFQCISGESRIIVADELAPDMITNMNLDKVLGFVTEHGGITSHAAILARSLGIPAVSGIHDIMKYAQCGDIMLIDSDKGEVCLNPDQESVANFVSSEPAQFEDICLLGTPMGMEVFANASSIDDVNQARAMGADGIGLYRTEMLFINAERLLTENEQYVYYRKIVSAMRGKPVTFRMLDVGGDKQLPFLKLKKETNPYLGWRGSRFLLGNPDIFKTQFRALAMLSVEFDVNIMFPMVVDAAQQQELLDMARESMIGCKCDPARVKLGAMFEVPSSFLQAQSIFKLIDFGSIGSNDLIQYLFAIDRTNELVSKDYDPDHPIVWDLLALISEIARNNGKKISICGEMAGREGMTTKLLDKGIKSLSVSPRLIPRVKKEMAMYEGIFS